MARATGVCTIYIGVSVVTGTGVLRACCGHTTGVLCAYYGCAVGILLVCCGHTAGVLCAYYGCAVGILLVCCGHTAGVLWAYCWHASHPLVNTTVITKGKSDD